MAKISFGITKECNRECIYCERGKEYERYYDTHKQRTMDINDIKKIVSDVRRLPSDRFVYSPLKSVEFTGGEPLIDKDTTNLVLKAAEYCKDLHLTTGLYTNSDALHSNLEIDTLYKHLDVIQIGVHDYSNSYLDSLFDIVKQKAESEGSNNKELVIHFIVNEETKKQLPKIKDEINKIGIYETVKSNISFTFHDMIPFGQSDKILSLRLPKGSMVMDKLYEYYEGIFSELECDKNIKVMTKKNGVAIPSTCNLKDDTFVIDAYGNLRFCPVVYGHVFGSMRDGNIEAALTEREKWYRIFYLYDPFGAPAELAREIGKVDPDKCYRGYCCFTLSRLFYKYKTPDMLVKDIEKKIMSKENPLKEVPEEYRGYDLTLFRKRALQEVLSEEPIDLLDITGMPYKRSRALPEVLGDKVILDALQDVVDNSPEKVTEELLQGEVMNLLYDADDLFDLKKKIGTILRESADKRAKAAMTHE